LLNTRPESWYRGKFIEKIKKKIQSPTYNRFNIEDWNWGKKTKCMRPVYNPTYKKFKTLWSTISKHNLILNDKRKKKD
jgi:hypothetical protein